LERHVTANPASASRTCFTAHTSKTRTEINSPSLISA